MLLKSVLYRVIMSGNEEGPYYEDFEIGSKYRSRNGRTLTDNDNIWFSLITNNSNQIHFNSDYTGKFYPGEPFNGRLVVNGMLTMAVVVGLTVEYTSSRGFMLSLDKAEFVNPVFAGDTLYGEVEITGKRLSGSRPGFGIVTISTTGRNQKNDIVVTFERKFMVPEKNVTWNDGKKED